MYYMKTDNYKKVVRKAMMTAYMMTKSMNNKAFNSTIVCVCVYAFVAFMHITGYYCWGCSALICLKWNFHAVYGWTRCKNKPNITFCLHSAWLQLIFSQIDFEVHTSQFFTVSIIERVGSHLVRIRKTPNMQKIVGSTKAIVRREREGPNQISQPTWREWVKNAEKEDGEGEDARRWFTCFVLPSI